MENLKKYGIIEKDVKRVMRVEKNRKSNLPLIMVCVALIVASFTTLFVVFTAKDHALWNLLFDGDSNQITLGKGDNTSNIPLQNLNLNGETLLWEDTAKGDSYLDKFLFIGDSRTVAMEHYGFVDADQVLAIDGLSHVNAQTAQFEDGETGRTVTMEEKVEEEQPELILVSYGINGVAYLDEETFMEEYESMIAMLKYASPDSIIVLQSILPVSDIMERNDPRLNNKAIDNYNTLLFEMAERTHIYFLNTAEVLKDEDGELKDEYDSGDGLHYNSSAYEVIFDYIKSHPVPGI